jgi:hypothetical protein
MACACNDQTSQQELIKSILGGETRSVDADALRQQLIAVHDQLHRSMQEDQDELELYRIVQSSMPALLKTAREVHPGRIPEDITGVALPQLWDWVGELVFSDYLRIPGYAPVLGGLPA